MTDAYARFPRSRKCPERVAMRSLLGVDGGEENTGPRRVPLGTEAEGHVITGMLQAFPESEHVGVVAEGVGVRRDTHGGIPPGVTDGGVQNVVRGVGGAGEVG